MQRMADAQFEDVRTARLYDALCGKDERDDFKFYLPLILAARRVLDVGCGTGALLRWAHERGHRGRLVGLDPAEGMLSVAGAETSIEWVRGDLSTTSFDREFDLVVMSGHAFQVFVEEGEIRRSLHAIRACLDGGGVFAFETRNPDAREWERWTDGYHEDFLDDDGTQVRYTANIESTVIGEVVSFESSYLRADWDEPAYSHSTLRLLGIDDLTTFLTDADLEITEQYGDWDHTPLTPTSPEIITVARASHGRRSPSPR